MIQPPAKNFTGVERAAVLMMLVGEEEAAAILQKLDPEEVRQLGAAMFAVADVGEPDVERVLDDFVGRARERTAIGFDPPPKITAVMNRALGPEKADSVLARITPAEECCAIDLLDWLEAPDIAAMVEKEHPQVAALLLANLDPAVAAKVLELLPDAIQPDILHRVARLGPITPEAIEGELQTNGLPPLDLVIRTSGEQRLSNFLLWQAAYAELLFVDTLWPDFDETALADAVAEFGRRHRRFGGL